MKIIYQKLFEQEIPDRFLIPITDISFKPVNGGFDSEVKHSYPAEFMSKIIGIIKNYISKHKKEVFSFSGEARENEDSDKSTTRIKIYQKIINKFINPKNIIRLPNKLLFFSESKQLQELNVITNIDKKSMSKNKLKFVKLDLNSEFIRDLTKLTLEKVKEYFMDKLEMTEEEILNTIFIMYEHKYIFIQVDKNFKKGFLIFEVYFDTEESINSKKLERYDLENSEFVSNLNKKGKLKPV